MYPASEAIRVAETVVARQANYLHNVPDHGDTELDHAVKTRYPVMADSVFRRVQEAASKGQRHTSWYLLYDEPFALDLVCLVERALIQAGYAVVRHKASDRYFIQVVW